MPSSKDPNAVVNPGSGKVPAGTVSISALSFPSGGGGGSDDLAAHISNPTDAHMAGAIGIPETDPLTGEALLSTLGGSIDGESVLDFIRMAKDLLPPRPDRLGFNLGVPNSGLPNWGDLRDALETGQAYTGGFTDAGTFVPTNTIVPNGTTSAILSGMLYPADRGVLAVYYCTDGTYSNGTTSLIAALWLGSTTAPAGIPSASFVESTRKTSQTDFTASGSGINKISLTYRLPYAPVYGGGVPYAPFTGYPDFPAFQLATYTTTLPISADKAGSYLLVHWREGFVASLSSISSFNTSNLTAINCYSGVPSGGNYDVGAIKTCNKHNIFRDSLSGSPPAGTVATTSPTGTTFPLTGVSFYASDLSLTLQVNATNLFNKGYLTGVVSDPPNVPANFVGTATPVEVNLTAFGVTSGAVHIPYTSLKDSGAAFFNGTSNVPLTSDTAQYGPTSGFTIPVLSPSTYAAPTGGFAQIVVSLRRGGLSTSITDTKKYLYNGYPQTGGGTASTETLEKFVDEKYRVDTTYTPLFTDLLPPTGGADYNSSSALVIYGGGTTTPKVSLQVIGGRLQYPQTDYSAAAFVPTGPNYNAIFLGDPLGSRRAFVRAFNTGIPRNTGRLRIKGIHLANFVASGAIDSSGLTDHTGHILVGLQVPGGTGLLDLGRVKGDPDLLLTDYRGCRTAIDTTGTDGDIFSYDMTAMTQDNGSGQFLLYVTIMFIKETTGGTSPGGGVVENVHVDEIEWLQPL